MAGLIHRSNVNESVNEKVNESVNESDHILSYALAIRLKDEQYSILVEW